MKIEPRYCYELRRSILENFGSQEKFAYHLGISGTIISKVVRGYKIPSKPLAKKMSEALGVDVLHLLTKGV